MPAAAGSQRQALDILGESLSSRVVASRRRSVVLGDPVGRKRAQRCRFFNFLCERHGHDLNRFRLLKADELQFLTLKKRPPRHGKPAYRISGPDALSAAQPTQKTLSRI